IGSITRKDERKRLMVVLLLTVNRSGVNVHGSGVAQGECQISQHAPNIARFASGCKPFMLRL
ncbi:MAG: hypothetical protein KDA63_08680, partial [Planctomycetales bacterium]|nr:hypothetical protein [Planctomycetales bacterium]